MREVECTISKIIINEQRDGQVIWIQEKSGRRAFAVIVGFFEASSLRDRVKGFSPPRPLTHDLINNCIRGLGGKLQRVVVTQLKDNTYFAHLVVDQDGKTVEIDARPSDALVLAVQESVPVYVAEDVLAEASRWSIKPEINMSIDDLAESLGEGFDEDSEPEWEEDEDDDEEHDEEDDEEEQEGESL